jgi:hypothetical protein
MRFFITAATTTTLIVTGGMGTFPASSLSQIPAQELANSLPPVFETSVNSFLQQIDVPPLPAPEPPHRNPTDVFWDSLSTGDFKGLEDLLLPHDANLDSADCPEGEVCASENPDPATAADCPEGEVCSTEDPNSATTADCPEGEVCSTEDSNSATAADCPPGEVCATEDPQAVPAGDCPPGDVCEASAPEADAATPASDPAPDPYISPSEDGAHEVAPPDASGEEVTPPEDNSGDPPSE